MAPPSAPTRLATVEVVPLAERFGYLQAFRVAGAAVAGGLLLRAGTADVVVVVLAATGFAAATGALGALGLRLARGRGLLNGGLLLLDGLALGAVTQLTGMVASPARYLVLAHLVLVALLASYRTGLKLAFWHALVLLVLQEAAAIDLLPATGTMDRSGMLTWIAAMWGITLLTAAASAVNERELRRRRYDLEALASMARELESATEPRAVAAVFCRAIADTFGFRRLALLGIRDGVAFPLTGMASSRVELPLDASSFLLEATSSRQPVLAAHLRPDDAMAQVLPEAANVAAVPLTAEERTVAVLVAEHGGAEGARVERRTLSTLERFAAHAALSLQNAWLHQALERRADTDGLTGVWNRRRFDQFLDEELQASRASGEPLSVVLVDIDHFKQVNDVHGHLMGDEVLRVVAATLDVAVRDAGVVARYGGEEFAVVVPGADRHAVRDLAERLRLAIASCDGPISVTASLGAAQLPSPATTAPELLEQADRALYRSKRDGRNRVTVGEPEPAAASRTIATVGGTPS